MKDQLLYKQNYWLPFAFAIILLLAWHFAFRITLTAWIDNHALSGTISHIGMGTGQPDYSERKIAGISRLIERYQSDTVSFRENIVKATVGRSPAPEAKIISFPSLKDNANLKIGQQSVRFQGDFYSLLKTLQRLEQETGIVRSVTVKLEKGSAYNNTADHLIMDLTLFFIKKKS